MPAMHVLRSGAPRDFREGAIRVREHDNPGTRVLDLPIRVALCSHRRMENEDLVVRINRLKKLVVLALLLALIAPVGAVVGCVAYLKSIAPTLSLEVTELRARRYVVVNESRRSRATLEANGDEAELALGIEGKGRVALRALDGNAQLALGAPAGERTSLSAEGGLARVALRDASGHDVRLGVASPSAESWRGGLTIRGGELTTRLESTEAATELAAEHENAAAETSLAARLFLDKAAGSGLDLATWSGDTRYRHAELSAPSVEARVGAAFRIEQRGSSLTARIGGVPRISLQQGATSIWESPVPRGAPADEEAEAAEETEAAPAPPPAPGPAPAPPSVTPPAP
jgi:hypothetical protein